MASQPVRTGWLGGTTFSTVTHGALIAIAVVSTGTTISSVHEDRAAERYERITYIEPARLMDVLRKTETAKATGAKVKGPELELPNAAVAAIAEVANTPIEIPDMTAATDLTAVTEAWLAQPDGMATQTTSLASLLSKKTGFIAPENGIYTADLVERRVEPKRGNPKPRYPSALADMGIEGTFLVRFVVDSTGTVPEDKIEFPSTMHRLFVSAVRLALLKSRYTPAIAGGHVVAQEVMQEFRFEVNNRRR